MYLKWKWHFASSIFNGFWKIIFILYLKWNRVYHLIIYKIGNSFPMFSQIFPRIVDV